MVSFLAPLFLVGSIAAAVPIVLHLLAREPETRVRFSAVKLLRWAPVEHTRRRHLNEILLLLLRVAALLLLAAAFARPFFAASESAATATLTVVALDTSLSLSAPGRFEAARERAKAIVAAADTDLVAVVTFADAAVVASPPSADRGLARSSLDAAEPGFGATRYRTAFNAAAELFDGRAGALAVVTDAQASGWKPADEVRLPEAVRIELADLGPAPPNFAVVGARASGGRVIAAVRNASAEARDARVRLTVDGRPAGEAMVTVEAGQTAETALPAIGGRDGIVAVDDPGGVAGDNAWHLVLETASRPAVLVVTTTGDLDRDAFYLRRAIGAAGPRGAVYEAAGRSAAALSSPGADALARYAAVVLVSTKGLDGRGRERLAQYVREGGGLLIAGGPDLDSEIVSGLFGGMIGWAGPDSRPRAPGVSMAPEDVRHPVIEPFAGGAASLGLATFRRIAGIDARACETLARFTSGGPALADCSLERGRVLVFASDLDNAWNDFPRHAAFVPFVHQAVRYLGQARPAAGEYLVGEAPAGAPPVPGFATIDDGGGSRRIAVNVDPGESAPDRLTPADFEAPVMRVADAPGARGLADARHVEERQHIWQYLLGLMVATLALESALGSRAH